MKEKVTLKNWRFELLKSPSDSWQQLRVGGHTDEENSVAIVDTVVDLQGFRDKQQFKSGYTLETENYTVTLGKQEKI